MKGSKWIHNSTRKRMSPEVSSKVGLKEDGHNRLQCLNSYLWIFPVMLANTVGSDVLAKIYVVHKLCSLNE